MLNNRPKKNARFRYVWIILILAVIVSITYFSHVYKPLIYKQLDNLHLIPRQEHFTELYFNNHTNLPKKPAIKETITFSFAIHNLEGKDKEYPYAVYSKNDKYGTINIDQRAVLVKDNEEKIITEKYTSNSNTDKETIFVELIDQRQEIHFALTKEK